VRFWSCVAKALLLFLLFHVPNPVTALMHAIAVRDHMITVFAWALSPFAAFLEIGTTVEWNRIRHAAQVR